jgi:hypothetical protein
MISGAVGSFLIPNTFMEKDIPNYELNTVFRRITLPLVILFGFVIYYAIAPILLLVIFFKWVITGSIK